MDPFDPTNLLFSKIKTLEPEYASKIIGYLLLRDIGNKGLMRLAFGPETLLHQLIHQAKSDLGLPSNTFSTLNTPPSPSALNPIARPRNVGCGNAHHPFSQSSPRGIVSNGSPSSNSWPLNNSFNNGNLVSQKSGFYLSLDNPPSPGSPLHPPSFNRKNLGLGGGGDSSGDDLMDERQLNDCLSFLNDSSSKNEEFVDPMGQYGYSVVNTGDTHSHRRSFSASDACIGSEDGGLGLGFKPCLYFARGFCKNGDNCKFVHGDFPDNLDENGLIVGSPSKLDFIYQQQQQHEEMRRLKATQHQRLAAAQFMNGVSQFPYDKSMNFILHPQHDPQRAAMMFEEECFRYGPGRLDRNDIMLMGLADRSNSASRQIYLTFPADSTFKDEDVSNYFSLFGQVQDVRIPYQQKRMFGFVTFLHSETVKLILARGNPHFICDSRVLVKPYKEKGKLLDKKHQQLQQQHQQIERGAFSPESSPTEIDFREQYDFHLGAKAFFNSREMLLRRKMEEQADLQQAIELQSRRFMNLQLPDFRNEVIHNHHRSLSVGSPRNISSHVNHDFLQYENPSVASPRNFSSHVNQAATSPPPTGVTVKKSCVDGRSCHDNSEGSSKSGKSDLHELSQEGNVDHVLPDNLFVSPTQFVGDRHTDFPSLLEVNGGNTNAKSAISSSSENKPPCTPSN